VEGETLVALSLKALARSIATLLMALAISVELAGDARAHCDTLDGPVIKAARQALETSDVNLVLIWVQKKDEREIASAFQETLAVRKLNPSAKALADRFFFETLVRIHRAGEGAPFTGLKAAGADLGPAVPAGDKALEGGSIEPVIKLLTKAVQNGLTEHFKIVMAKKGYSKADVAAGREYVEAYVTYIHYVEGIYEAATAPVHGHYPEPVATANHPN
jgi:hypothetical protein